jgi:hypothetical protein
MTDGPNTTADDTNSAAAGPPEASSVPTPAEAMAPAVDVTEVAAAEGGIPADAGRDDSAAEDFNPDAAAPEPSD